MSENVKFSFYQYVGYVFWQWWTIHNSILNCKVQYRDKIQHSSLPYHIVYGENIAKPYSHPLKNGGHIGLTGFFENFIEILKNNTHYSILHKINDYFLCNKLWLEQ